MLHQARFESYSGYNRTNIAYEDEKRVCSKCIATDSKQSRADVVIS